MKCVNCDDLDATCSCKECGNVLLCDKCFDEIHKLNIFSSHRKSLLDNINLNSDDGDDDDDDDAKDENNRDHEDSLTTPDKKIRAIQNYISFLEAFVIENLTLFKIDADTTLQKMCETLSDIHAVLYDFESKMRTIINDSAFSSKKIMQKALGDISQFQKMPISSQVENANLAQLTKQVSSRVCDTMKSFHLENIDVMLSELKKVKVIASSIFPNGDLTWCEDPSESKGCAIYRKNGGLIFNFKGVPSEVANLVARYPFINYKVEIKKVEGEVLCLNMGKGKRFKNTIVKNVLDDAEVKMAVGYLDVPGCNVWESESVNTAGFYCNKANGQMTFTIMNPVLDSFDDDDDDDSEEYDKIDIEGFNEAEEKDGDDDGDSSKDKKEVKEKEKENANDDDDDDNN